MKNSRMVINAKKILTIEESEEPPPLEAKNHVLQEDSNEEVQISLHALVGKVTLDTF